jgi:hypothetical protein
MNRFRRTNTTRQKAGLTAKRAGESFEQEFERMATLNNFSVIRIPDGCRQVRDRSGRMKLLRVRTPFDYLISKRGFHVCVDCKSTDGSTFPYSAITHHQIQTLQRISKDTLSGYVVLFKELRKVVFFPSSRLWNLKPKTSLRPEDGIDLGGLSHNSNFEVLKTYWENQSTYDSFWVSKIPTRLTQSIDQT